jgi:hypothetical protein
MAGTGAGHYRAVDEPASAFARGYGGQAGGPL